MGDLDRTHHCRQTAGGRPVETVGNAVEQAGTVGVAATGRIENFFGLDTGNIVALTVGVDLGPLATARYDQRLHFASQLFQAAPGTVTKQLGLVIVEAGVIGQLDEIEQFVAVEHRQALARIENEGHVGIRKVTGVLHHALAAIRRDDAEFGIGTFNLVQMRKSHRPWMEGGDLIVVEVGRDESLCREAATDLADMATRQAELVEAIEIGCCIVAHGGHDRRLATEQHQVVGNIAGAAAKFAAHFRHQESHIKDVDLLRQDVVLEAVRKDHDVVKGQGTADQCCHGESGIKDVKAIAGGADFLGLNPQSDGNFTVGWECIGSRTGRQVFGSVHDPSGNDGIVGIGQAQLQRWPGLGVIGPWFSMHFAVDNLKRQDFNNQSIIQAGRSMPAIGHADRGAAHQVVITVLDHELSQA
eukprot:TRINITY_DN3184_c0_g1_i14.p1 TRINITY_DN3184_c0_g1~~TRINITY_DN3184_c0_g1_i14.p1  ORF type:complete len:414 (-),score=39.68 TRINITY_DN3184_c0_g1_i14:727-1968(-)